MEQSVSLGGSCQKRKYVWLFSFRRSLDTPDAPEQANFHGTNLVSPSKRRPARDQEKFSHDKSKNVSHIGGPSIGRVNMVEKKAVKANIQSR